MKLESQLESKSRLLLPILMGPTEDHLYIYQIVIFYPMWKSQLGGEKVLEDF